MLIFHSSATLTHSSHSFNCSTHHLLTDVEPFKESDTFVECNCRDINSFSMFVPAVDWEEKERGSEKLKT